MESEQLARKTVALLKQKVRDYVYANRDTLQAFENRVFYARWLDQVGGKMRLNMGALFKCLDAIKVDPTEFIREVLEGDDDTTPSHCADTWPEGSAPSVAAPAGRPLDMAWSAANFLLTLGKAGTPRRTLLSWRSDAAKARLSALLEAAQRAGLDELQFLVSALSGFAVCGEDVAHLVAKVLGTERDRLTREINQALEALHIALGVRIATPGSASAMDTPERFLGRFRELWTKRGEGTGTLGQEWLEEMDERRYTDAPGVVAEFDRWLEEIEPEQVPLALGVLGSALRLDFWYTRAEMALELGLEFADEVLDHSAAGDLHLRRTMVKWDQGEEDAAMAQNGLAFSRYLEAQDKVGKARATVDKGGLLIYRAEFRRAVKVFHAALELLPVAETRNRASALEGLAHCYAQLGEIAKARHHGELALSLPRSRFSLGKAQWTMAVVEHSAENYGTALVWLRKSKETLFPVSPVDAALVSIDIMETLVRTKDTFAAKNEARQMLQYIEPLRARTPLAEAAAHGLALAGTRAEGLSVASLLMARKEIQARPIKG